MGYVQRKELMSLYHNVDALIVTSREDTGPLMINECVALGIFVISTPIGVANDLIIEKQNGIITRDVSSDAISDALISFLDNYNMTRSEVEHVSASQTRRSSLTFDGYIRALMDVIKPCS
jgi:glycosyltransferase involved in cell wall biosynthesis